MIGRAGIKETLKTTSCLIIIFFCVAVNGVSQTPDFKYLGIENGLSNNSVTTAYQDHIGFMWFGTFDGLNRYDGYNFKVFRNEFNDANSLPHNYITAINEDPDHNLWIGTGQGISTYNHLTTQLLPAFYIPYQKKTATRISASISGIEIDSSGNVFIGTTGSGLLVRLKNSNQTIQLPFKPAAGITALYRVSAMKTDKKNRVWLFIDEAGLCMYDKTTSEIRLVNATFKSANCMAADDSGHLWIGTDNGLSSYDISSDTFASSLTEKSGSLTVSKVVSICIDKDKKLWIGTDGGGINVLNPFTGKLDYFLPERKENSLTSETISAIYLDKQDRTWIGTLRGGINILDPHKNGFVTVRNNPQIPNSLTSNFVLSFFEDSKHQVWIGTDGGGLSIWDRSKNSFTNFRHDAANPASISNNFVACIKNDYQNNIWIATYGGGINRFNKANNSFDHYACVDEVTGVENKNALLLYEDKDKDMWACTFDEGRVYKLNRQKNKFEMFDRMLINIISITEDKSGVLWAGNASQLIKIDKRFKKHIFYTIGKPVRAILEDNEGSLWLGTEGGGLLRFNKKNGTFIRYTTENGLCNNSVLNILEDNKSRLWMSTFNGISRFNPVKKDFKNYYQNDGLQSNQFSFNAGVALTSGELLFGGIRGFNIFYPDSIGSLDHYPPVLLTGLRINNSSIENNPSYITKTSGDNIATIQIPYNEAVLSFDFTALEYTAPDKIAYAYYLKDWDKSWNYTGNIRTANYSHLDEGVYELRIKSTNAEGIWNNIEFSIKVVILPPWYRSWWAYLIYFSIIASVIYGYIFYKNRQAKLQFEVKVARIEAEKERELNEQKILFFTNVSHEFRTPLSLIINPIKDILHNSEPGNEKHALNIIYRNARRLLRLVDQLLLFKKADSELGKLNIVKLNLYNLCKEVYLCFAQQALTKSINFELEADNKELKIFADHEKIEIILFNLLSNAFKYTPENGKVTFRILEHENDVEIVISDTGIGIPADTGNRLFERFFQGKENNRASGGFGIGLYLVKNFIEAHEGKIFYESKEGIGTTFFITLKRTPDAADVIHFDKEAEQSSVLLKELLEDVNTINTDDAERKDNTLDELVTDRKSLLIVDDDKETVQYLSGIFKHQYKVFEAGSGEDGIKQAHDYLPDLIICDVLMTGIGGIDLCKNLKEDSKLSHIPVILITGSSSDEFKLKGIESGADDYIRKPFDKDILTARVSAILRSRNTLQRYFYNEITLQSNNLKVSVEYKEFLEKCILIVENHLDDQNFSIKSLSSEIGMSHSNLYRKIKSVSGLSANAFIRFIRLRKGAEILINSENNVNQTAAMVGFNDVKHFREQFNKLFGMNPSEYIKKFRKPFHNTQSVRKFF